MNLSVRVSSQYGAALQFGLFHQGVVAALILSIFDAPHVASFLLVVMLAHGFGMLVLVVRRPALPTHSDLWFFRYGFTPFLFVAVLLAQVVWRLVGEETLFQRWFGVRLQYGESIGGPLLAVCAGWSYLYLILILVRSYRFRVASVARGEVIHGSDSNPDASHHLVNRDLASSTCQGRTPADAAER